MKRNNDFCGIVPLNNDLFDGFSIEELEARLETDPLMLSQVLVLPITEGIVPCYHAYAKSLKIVRLLYV